MDFGRGILTKTALRDILQRQLDLYNPNESTCFEAV